MGERGEKRERGGREGGRKKERVRLMCARAVEGVAREARGERRREEWREGEREEGEENETRCEIKDTHPDSWSKAVDFAALGADLRPAAAMSGVELLQLCVLVRRALQSTRRIVTWMTKNTGKSKVLAKTLVRKIALV